MIKWHFCSYTCEKLIHDGSWEDGKWYEWLDKYGNKEVARMKSDSYDHFYPPTKTLREKDIVAFRERSVNEQIIRLHPKNTKSTFTE